MNKIIEQRDYQTRIITKTLEAFSANVKSVMIESPTGSGKTITALQILKKLEEVGMKFGWVAMRRKLLTQAESENAHIGVKNIHFISMFDKNPPKVDLLCFDEAQHSSAVTSLALHNATGARFSLGLTATPFRTDKVKLAYEKIISDYGVKFLIEKGYLSPFEQYIIPKWTPQSVAERYLASPEKWGKSIIYMQTKTQCLETETYLKNAGIKCATVLGEQSDFHKDEIYGKFEEGEIKVLLNIYLLSEGFDCPDMGTAWVRDSCRLPTMQMAGRVLRKNPKNPAKMAKIVQSEQTKWSYAKTARASQEYVWQDEQWRSIRPSQQIDVISNLVRAELYTKPIELPKFLDKGGNRILVTKKAGIITKERKKRYERSSDD